MFSGVRKNPDGSLNHFEPAIENRGDSFGVAIAENVSKAWLNGKVVSTGSEVLRWEKLKYHGLNGRQIVRGSYLCVPLSFIAEVFDANLEVMENGTVAVLTLPDGKTFQFAEGCIGCVVDNRIESMLCEAIFRNDKLYISMEWFSRFAYNLQVSEFEGVIYITDHYAEISRYMSWLLQDILSDSPKYLNYGEEK
jgi:hypothetical protein